MDVEDEEQVELEEMTPVMPFDRRSSKGSQESFRSSAKESTTSSSKRYEEVAEKFFDDVEISEA